MIQCTMLKDHVSSLRMLALTSSFKDEGPDTPNQIKSKLMDVNDALSHEVPESDTITSLVSAFNRLLEHSNEEILKLTLHLIYVLAGKLYSLHDKHLQIDSPEVLANSIIHIMSSKVEIQTSSALKYLWLIYPTKISERISESLKNEKRSEKQMCLLKAIDSIIMKDRANHLNRFDIFIFLKALSPLLEARQQIAQETQKILNEAYNYLNEEDKEKMQQKLGKYSVVLSSNNERASPYDLEKSEATKATRGRLNTQGNVNAFRFKSSVLENISEAAIEPFEQKNFASGEAVKNFLDRMIPAFEGKENEDNWKIRESLVRDIRQVFRGNAMIKYRPLLLKRHDIIVHGLLKCINTLRTTLSLNACNAIKELAYFAGDTPQFEYDAYFNTLLKASATTKKLVAQASFAAICVLFDSVPYTPRFLSSISLAVKDKNFHVRNNIPVWLSVILQAHRNEISQNSNSFETIESLLKTLLQDASKDVRDRSRETLQIYSQTFPQKAQRFVESLDPKIQKHLIAFMPNQTKETEKSRPFTQKPPSSSQSVKSAVSTQQTESAAPSQSRNNPERNPVNYSSLPNPGLSREARQHLRQHRVNPVTTNRSTVDPNPSDLSESDSLETSLKCMQKENLTEKLKGWDILKKFLQNLPQKSLCSLADTNLIKSHEKVAEFFCKDMFGKENIESNQEFLQEIICVDFFNLILKFIPPELIISRVLLIKNPTSSLYDETLSITLSKILPLLDIDSDDLFEFLVLLLNFLKKHDKSELIRDPIRYRKKLNNTTLFEFSRPDKKALLFESMNWLLEISKDKDLQTDLWYYAFETMLSLVMNTKPDSNNYTPMCLLISRLYEMKINALNEMHLPEETLRKLHAIINDTKKQHHDSSKDPTQLAKETETLSKDFESNSPECPGSTYDELEYNPDYFSNLTRVEVSDEHYHVQEDIKEKSKGGNDNPSNSMENLQPTNVTYSKVFLGAEYNLLGRDNLKRPFEKIHESDPKAPTDTLNDLNNIIKTYKDTMKLDSMLFQRLFYLLKQINMEKLTSSAELNELLQSLKDILVKSLSLNTPSKSNTSIIEALLIIKLLISAFPDFCRENFESLAESIMLPNLLTDEISKFPTPLTFGLCEIFVGLMQLKINFDDRIETVCKYINSKQNENERSKHIFLMEALRQIITASSLKDLEEIIKKTTKASESLASVLKDGLEHDESEIRICSVRICETIFKPTKESSPLEKSLKALLPYEKRALLTYYLKKSDSEKPESNFAN